MAHITLGDKQTGEMRKVAREKNRYGYLHLLYSEKSTETSSLARRLISLRSLVAPCLFDRNPHKKRPRMIESIITFSEGDMEGVVFPHSDALVVTM